MKTSSLSTTMAVFLIFFGASVIDAFATRAWLRASFWMIIALLFLAADWMGRRRQSPSQIES